MWYNRFMIPLLKSPLHPLVGQTMMLITITGRKSGKRYEVPVNYVRAGERLIVVSQRDRTWWRNLRGGAPVSVRLRGQVRSAHAAAYERKSEVMQGLTEFLQGMPRAASHAQVRLDSQGVPNAEDVANAADSRVVIEVNLTSSDAG